MTNISFLISAYFLLWIILFGYVLVMFKRLNRLSQQIEMLKAEKEKK